MTEHEDRPGAYDPSEDTGDWPFRESMPPPVEVEVDVPPKDDPSSTRPFDLEAAAPEQAAAVPEADEDVEPPVADEESPAAETSEPDVVDEAVADDSPPDVAESPDVVEHAPGALRIPDGLDVLEGSPNGFRRTVAVVVSRYNAEITNKLLERALSTLSDAHVGKESITIVPVPGAFELPLAAMALAKTRRFSCVVALGCVIRGETSHFDFVAGEAASGLQLAAIETGVPVSFGLLTCETTEQAEARIDRASDAVHAALEMADLFTQVRTRAARAG